MSLAGLAFYQMNFYQLALSNLSIIDDYYTNFLLWKLGIKEKELSIYLAF